MQNSQYNHSAQVSQGRFGKLSSRFNQNHMISYNDTNFGGSNFNQYNNKENIGD
jgi:hypothetical protein